MILAARERGAWTRCWSSPSALSVQDLRDRPMDMQAAGRPAAREVRRREVASSRGYLKLWKWIHAARGGHDNEHKLSNRQYEQLLRQNFINVRRVREWRDIHSQLHTVVAEHSWQLNTHARRATSSCTRRCWPACWATSASKSDDDGRGTWARAASSSARHPGAHLKKKPGPLDRGGRTGGDHAPVRPRHRRDRAAWIEQVGGHLLKKQLLEPHWEKKAAEVMALERATLYGLVVYSSRRVNFAQVDPARRARDLHPRRRWWPASGTRTLPFLAHNQKLIAQVEELEHKSRRQDVLVDDELIYAFYDQQLPADVYSGATFERWYRDERRRRPEAAACSRATS